MSNDGKSNWELYDYYLANRGMANKHQSIRSAVSSFKELTSSNPGYQTDAKRNGEIQPMLITRDKNTCKVTINPNDELFIGDLVEAYNEHWLVVDMYTDEYGLSTGSMWLCNHIFKFQNHSSKIIECYGVIDDGSYSSLALKQLTTADADYNFYLPLNEDTDKIYIDKRFAIAKMYNTDGNEIMQVMKITWVDKINNNYGVGSHLLKMRATADVYTKDIDNLEFMVCNYIEPDETKEQPDVDPGEDIPPVNDVIMEIGGRDTVRIGTTRTYEISVSDNEGNQLEGVDIIWNAKYNPICTVIFDGKKCSVSIPLDYNLVGEQIILSAEDTINGVKCDKVVEVISIG